MYTDNLMVIIKWTLCPCKRSLILVLKAKTRIILYEIILMYSHRHQGRGTALIPRSLDTSRIVTVLCGLPFRASHEYLINYVLDLVTEMMTI